MRNLTAGKNGLNYQSQFLKEVLIESGDSIEEVTIDSGALSGSQAWKVTFPLLGKSMKTGELIADMEVFDDTGAKITDRTKIVYDKATDIVEAYSINQQIAENYRVRVFGYIQIP